MIEAHDLKFIEDNMIHLEQVRLGFIQGMDDRKKHGFHAIHQKYIGLMTLTVWCSSCIIDMMKRIDKWYKKYLETYKVDDFVFPDDLDKIKPIVPVAEPKPIVKRGRKPKK
jgi:hypothetical protein